MNYEFMKKYLILFLISIYSACVFSQGFNQPVEYQPISFQSTSTMQSIGSSYSSTPTIDEYGAATYNGVSIIFTSNRIGPRKNGTPSTPGVGGDNQQPIGDVPFIFMLSLCLLVILYKQFKKNDVKYIE